MESPENNEDASIATEDIIIKKKPDIKHLVFSGGGLAGFAFYGAIKECHQQSLWRLENIQTIYGTSVGTLLAITLALNYDWNTLDDYLIKRPWHNVFKFNLYTILDTIQRRGIFNIDVIKEYFLPLFNGKDIPIDVTMLEFYNITKIEIHLFASSINTFELVDISYKTHPQWKVVEAVYSSSAVPVVFSPLFKDQECYCDGALFTNYPLEQSVKNGSNLDEILGICYTADTTELVNVNSDTSLLDYIITIIKRFIGMIENKKTHTIAYEFYISSPTLSIYDLLNTTSDPSNRIQLIQSGIDVVKSVLLGSST
jgi:NTE family protein